MPRRTLRDGQCPHHQTWAVATIHRCNRRRAPPLLNCTVDEYANTMFAIKHHDIPKTQVTIQFGSLVKLCRWHQIKRNVELALATRSSRIVASSHISSWWRMANTILTFSRSAQLNSGVRRFSSPSAMNLLLQQKLVVVDEGHIVLDDTIQESTQTVVSVGRLWSGDDVLTIKTITAWNA